ncbi:MAG: threonine synthase [Syntrophomonadaceae bacterium]
MDYQSSRGQVSSVSAAQAITSGISPDGGLFLPDYIPILDATILEAMENWTYQERAVYILRQFLTDFSEEEIKECVYAAYNEENFDDEKIAPLVKINNKLFVQELWHGPTCAFKDMALQILPHFLTKSARKINETKEIIILVATSGDTGKAALEGFKDVAGTRIIVFFPEDGVSEVQKRQMVTQEGNNVYVAGVVGNFDDAQNGVKRIFGDENIIARLGHAGMRMSSANSINWGRLLPQIVYYVSAYVDLKQRGAIKAGEKVNIVVPTGNFGNILAAYYAMRMGIPVNRLICAANTNNVLTEFIRTGVYNRNRTFEKTISPSMDILISSNLERLLYEVTEHNSEKVSAWMKELKENGIYQVDEATASIIQQLFWSDFCSDDETIDAIKSTWDRENYLLDTHTAVAFNVYQKFCAATGDNHTTIIASTASPFKFGSSVAQGVFSPEQIEGQSEFAVLNILADATGWPIPEAIRGLEQREIRHNVVTSCSDMEKTVLAFLGIK